MKLKKYNFETGIYRPPSEGGSASLLLRFTRNCPWNHCTFCTMYKNQKFSLRPLSDIRADITAMAALAQDLKTASLTPGQGGTITEEAISLVLETLPELKYHQGVSMLVHWLISGGHTAFLQDGNSLIMKTGDLIAALCHLKNTFPSITRITTYARARTLVQKSEKDLRAIRRAGLDRLHLGLETGDGDLLKTIKKGITPEGQIQGGKKAMAAGFQVSEYWMPGLGGRQMTRAHATNTARVLTEINPHYIRSRPFRAIAGTRLYDRVRAGEVHLLSCREQLTELRQTLSGLDVTSRVCFDHAGNNWRDRQGRLLLTHDYEGYQFPQEKNRVLALIDEGLENSAQDH
ncbi:MAG: radical SAM protein [Proteobacteria bacterium]|nr:radical SAM protein [Desulfobacula sp.]MBU3951447.1 radical SAM protein [Pseudomonadota bacterium]MBU4132445.1 radical SAM protein [Pseudomonadota bacterium]